ncbi:MAG: rod shape-determining protein MreC [Chloroflexota bacterium]|nr:rod shape-determining protein MreC [Chloroflexota bacterium]
MSSVSPKQTVMLIVLFIAVSVAFILLDNQTALNPLKTGLRNLVNPVTDFVNDRGEIDPAEEGEWEARYHELEERYAQLESDYQRTRIVADQVQALQQMLDLQQSNPNVVLLPAQVISVDPTSTNKLIVINRGSADGVAVGMAVTDPNYYVGVVTKVEDNSAQVLLAIDSTHTVGVELEGSKASGVAYGMWQQGGRIELRYIDRNAEVNPEEKIVTTCAPDIRTANMPCGLIVGKVSGQPEVTNIDDVQTIQVIPAADFDNLSFVAVITSSGGQ